MLNKRWDLIGELLATFLSLELLPTKKIPTKMTKNKALAILN